MAHHSAVIFYISQNRSLIYSWQCVHFRTVLSKNSNRFRIKKKIKMEPDFRQSSILYAMIIVIKLFTVVSQVFLDFLNC